MLAAVHHFNTKENSVKMEEQTVPSAGFSPQPDPYESDTYESDYISKFTTQHQNHHQHQQQQQQQNYGQMLSIVDDSNSYCNLADNFDLSLLGDTYDHDMATVPSPSSWSQSSSLFEPTYWQQMSLYATSPSTDYRAVSPDCKPALSPVHPFGSNDNSYQGSPIICSRPQTPLSSSNNSSGGYVICNVNNSKNNLTSDADRHLLLRQRLEDTSFQRKYNFKPLDLPTLIGDGVEEPPSVREIGLATSSSTTNVGNALELNQIEPVFSRAFEEIRSDMQNVCSALAISPDPTQWSETDVQSWLAHTLSSVRGTIMPESQTNSPAVTAALRQFWNVDGRTLCSFNEEEFHRRLPISGDRIFAHFELWKTLQYKNCSTQLPTVLSEVSFASDDNVFDLEQLLLTPINSSTTSSTTNTTTATTSSVETTTTLSDNQIVNSPLTLNTSTSGGNSTAVSPSSLDTATSPASSSFSSPLAPELMNTDDDEEEEEEEEEKKPVVKSKTTGTNGTKSGAHIHLWQFLKELLSSPQQHGSCIRWLDQSRGVFKIEDSVRVARLWGLRKNRPAMNYDKLSRSIRQYYRKGIMRKTERSQRLVYQFCHPYGL